MGRVGSDIDLNSTKIRDFTGVACIVAQAMGNNA